MKNDCQWGKDFLDHISPTYLGNSTRVNMYNNMIANYRLYNNEINQEDFIRWCSPYGIDVGQYDEEVMPYNKTYNKINVLLGEEIKRGDSYKPVLLSQKDIHDKNDEIKGHIMAYVDAEINKAIFKAQQEQMQDMSEEEFQQMYEQLSAKYTPEDLQETEYMSEKEIFASRVLEYAKYDQEIKKQKNFGFKHALLSDMEIVHIDVDRGKPTIKMINPLFAFFQKGPDIEYIQDGDFAGHRFVMTRNQVMDTYGDDMTEKQREAFQRPFSMREGTKISNKIENFHENSLEARELRSMYSFDYIDENQGQHASDFSYKTSLDLVEVVHAEWRSFRKVYYLTYFNEYGEEEVDIVAEDYPLPEDAERKKVKNRFGREAVRYEWIDPYTDKAYMAEELWIPRIWEGTRIDGDIYVNVREKLYQPLSVDDPYRKAKLGYHGLVYTATNAKSISVMSRMRPFQFLYFIAMHQLSRLLARNQGKQIVYDLAQLPEFNDPFGRSNEELMLYYQGLGISFTNSMSNTQGGDMPPQRGHAVNAIDMSTTADMLNLSNLCFWLDEQIGEAAGISKPREGQMSPNSNVTDNQQSIAQSSHITEYYFNRHNELWRHIISYYLDCFIIWAKNWFEMNPGKKEFFLQYVLDRGSIASLAVTPEYLDNSDFGIFIELGTSSEEYRTKMEQLMLPLVQNQMQGAEAVSEILKSRRDGTSPEEIHKMIQTLSRKQEEQMQAQMEQQQQQLQQQAQAEQAIEQQKHQNKMEQLQLQETLRRETQVQVATIRAMSFDEDKDRDDDGMPDVLEVAKYNTEADIKMRKQKLDEEKFKHQKEVDKQKMEIEKKKAAQKPKSNS